MATVAAPATTPREEERLARRRHEDGERLARRRARELRRQRVDELVAELRRRYGELAETDRAMRGAQREWERTFRQANGARRFDAAAWDRADRAQASCRTLSARRRSLAEECVKLELELGVARERAR